MPEPMPEEVAFLLAHWNNPYRDTDPRTIDLMKRETCWTCGENCYTNRGPDVDGMPTQRDSCLVCEWRSPLYFLETTLLLRSTGYDFPLAASMHDFPAKLETERSLIAEARKGH